METPCFEITVRCSNMDDAMDIYCKTLAHRTSARAEGVLALKINGNTKELSRDRLDRAERPQLHIVQ